MKAPEEPCIRCGAPGYVGTKNSRFTSKGRRRRKVCHACGARWTTLEVVVDDDEPSHQHDPHAVRSALEQARDRLGAALALLDRAPGR